MVKPKTKVKVIKHGEKLFDVEDEPFPKGAWWWWFWLFFFNNPQDPSRPRQLMILWSTKNINEIDCNDLLIKLQQPIDKKNMDGAVAAWYFDGKKMHHNFLLEQCHIKLTDKSLTTDSKVPTSFQIWDKTNKIKIGDNIQFVAKATGEHDFLKPNHHGNNFIGGKGYGITKINRLDLGGTVDGKLISGTAYFQRVFVNAPAIPWFWGIYHFEKGAMLTYTYQWAMKKTLKRNVQFFDGEKLHEYGGAKVKRIGGDIPQFSVKAENDDSKIRFLVESYEHSSWTFKKKSLGVIPNKLVYNEYPGVIKGIEFTDKKTGKTLTEKELGKSVGNSEHTTGFLF